MTNEEFVNIYNDEVIKIRCNNIEDIVRILEITKDEKICQTLNDLINEYFELREMGGIFPTKDMSRDLRMLLMRLREKFEVNLEKNSTQNKNSNDKKYIKELLEYEIEKL